MDRLVNYSKVAIAAGIEERRVQIAERQGQLLADAIRGVLAELGVDMGNPDVPGIVRKHLTAINGTAREVERSTPVSVATLHPSCRCGP